jgi:NADH-quinone oxidoreductase subunit M
MSGLELSLEIPWHTQVLLPMLLLLQLLPLLGSALVYRLRNWRYKAPLATAIAALQLAMVLWLWWLFDPAIAAMQFAERLNFFGPFSYHVGLDGLNLIFLQLISLLSLALLLYAWIRKPAEFGRLLSLILLVNAATVSMVLTLDLFWFWLLANLQIWVISRLLSYWADGPAAGQALTSFRHFMVIGQLLLLSGILMLGWHYADIINGSWSFDLLALRQVNIHQGFNEIIFFLLILGLGLRVPVFPLHGWLPNILEQAGLGLAAVTLLGIKLGLYAMLRFILPLLPEAVVQWQTFMIGIAAFGTLYGAVLSMLQTNLRRQLAYITLSQNALILMGIFTLGKGSFQGSALLAVNFGLGMASLLLLMGLVCDRTSSTAPPRQQELIKQMPFIALVFFLSSLSLLAIPSAPGFDALLLVLEDAIRQFGALLAVFAALSNLVAASLMLWVFHQIFIATGADAESRSQPDAQPQKSGHDPIKGFLLLLLLLAGLAAIGLHPEAWFRLLEMPSSEIEQLFQISSSITQAQG